MTDIIETAPKVTYAIQTTSIDFYDAAANERRGAYATKAELKTRMAEGKKVNKHILLGKQVDSLEDARILARAAELGNNSYHDPYVDEDEGTRIVVRKIVKIEEIV